MVIDINRKKQERGSLDKPDWTMMRQSGSSFNKPVSPNSPSFLGEGGPGIWGELLGILVFLIKTLWEKLLT